MSLSLAQLDDGRKKALFNANELLNDARVLLNNGRWARALFLSQIAAEELGKYVIIISAAVNLTRARRLGKDFDSKKFWRDFWKRYRFHRAKMSLLVHLEHFFSEEKAHEYLKKIPEEAHLSEYVKMASLYSDFHEDAFCSPNELITEALSRLTVEVGKKRLNWLKSYDREIIGAEGLLKLTKKNIEYIERLDEKLGIKDLMATMLEDYRRK